MQVLCVYCIYQEFIRRKIFSENKNPYRGRNNEAGTEIMRIYWSETYLNKLEIYLVNLNAKSTCVQWTPFKKRLKINLEKLCDFFCHQEYLLEILTDFINLLLLLFMKDLFYDIWIYLFIARGYGICKYYLLNLFILVAMFNLLHL